MNRTIKFQLSNIKSTTQFSALIMYGIIGVFLGIAFLIDQSILSEITSQPNWLILLSLIIAPFTLLSMMYALFDGLMFFDTSLRFGISRRSYFITQVIIFLILSLLLSFADGVTEVEWASSTSTYFATIGNNYLSLGNIVSNFLETLILAIIALAVYRFKSKAFIAGIVLFGLFMAVSFFGAIGNSVLSEILMNTITFVADYKEIFVSLLVAGMIGVYYLFIMQTEVQD